MSQVAIIAKFTALSGQRAPLAAALQAALDTAEKEPGTRFYILHEDSANADVLVMYEMYENQEALAAHGSSEAFKALGPIIRPFTASRPEITMAKPIGGKGL